jgi:hypothetical protein
MNLIEHLQKPQVNIISYRLPIQNMVCVDSQCDEPRVQDEIEHSTHELHSLNQPAPQHNPCSIVM